MESKKINQLATELTPALSDLTIIGDPTTGISKKITLSQMASLFTGTVEEYANLAAFPLVGVADTIYIALDTNVLYRWDTGLTSYVELSPNIINSLVFSDANGFDGTISLVGSTATLTITTALTTGSVAFIGASGALLQDNSNFFWDDTNNRLGLGTNAPTTAIDVFGSGIIGRLNGTSTNNAFLGFASAGSNKWSIGNVQSDHRFRIYSEANTSELVSVLQTGEFGIGIANPTTKLHIDGGASALIANLDANVSVAKSISFRSDNSNRINLEVSGTESGSNAGANFFLRTYTDAGGLIETPLSIVRSTGVTTIKSLTLTNALSVANGGTGSTTQNFVDLTTTQTIGGAKTFTSALAGTSATFSGNVQSQTLLNALSSLGTVSTVVQSDNTAGYIGTNTNHPLNLRTNSTTALSLSTTGAATFLSSVTSTSTIYTNLSSGFVGYSIFQNGSKLVLAGGANGTQINNNANSLGLVSILDNGNVGIGTSSPNARLSVTTPTTGTEAENIRLEMNTASVPASAGLNFRFGSVNGATIYGVGENGSTGASSMRFYTYDGTSSAERMRITSAGKFQYGTSSDWIFNIQSSAGGYLLNSHNTRNVSGDVNALFQLGNNANNTSSYFLVCSMPSGDKMYILGNGNVQNTNNSYGAISDIKLKENIVDATPKLENLLKVKIRNYNLIGEETKQIGVIAQELEQIFPSMIDKTEDFKEVEIEDEEGNIIKERQSLGTTTKSVKYSVFVPMIIKAMQEQQAQIEELKALINK